MKTVTTITLTLLALGLAVPAESALINFDDLSGSVEIGDHYLSVGAKFFKGNAEKGASTSIVGSAWAYPGVYVSEPNVLVPQPGTNNDIFVHFFKSDGTRWFANYVSVQNDMEAAPLDIVLAAFDQSDNLLASVNITGAGGFGELNADPIWYAMIYCAPQADGSGLLGVDNFSFTLSEIPEPSFMLVCGLVLFVVGRKK